MPPQYVEAGQLQIARQALTRALSIAEEWIYKQLDGTPELEAELARLEPARRALEQINDDFAPGAEYRPGPVARHIERLVSALHEAQTENERLRALLWSKQRLPNQ